MTQYDNATAGSGSVVDEVKYTYDDWGNVTLFEQDRNSAVSNGTDEYEVAYTYEKATPSGGHDCVRRTYQKVNYAGTEKQSLQYEYLSTGNLLDDAASRVTQVKAGATTVAVYKYLGAGQLVSQQLAEAGVTNSRYGTGTANYDRLDRFNRIEKDRWTKDSGGDLYSADITFDESGNITRQVDNLQRNYGGGGNPGVFDDSYTIDSRNRLTRTQEGHWNGSSISTLWRDQQWTLSQTGNWARDKEDLNGDGDFTDTGEVDDTRTHNVANEMLTRDTDSNSSVNYTLTHDAVGNMTDDGKDYKFVYDALGRLKTVKNQSNTVVAEYTYNGLNMRIGWHYDADADTDVDANDPWYSFAMDDRWRIVATFRGSDTSPKELFAYHNAGANGRGGSSYIDSVILRNKDANTSWTSASDATLEERLYYAQNWRADVSAILTSAGLVKEWVKYTSYGIPVRIDPGDYNRDGFVNGTDFDDYGDDFDNARAEADVNFDGTVNGDDYDLFSEWWDAPCAAGRFTLSAPSIANRIGYAGYQYDPTFVGASRAVYHVRNRVYDAGLGRWLRRDPADLPPDLYEYANDAPTQFVDPLGEAPVDTILISHALTRIVIRTIPSTYVEFNSSAVFGFTSGSTTSPCQSSKAWLVQHVSFESYRCYDDGSCTDDSNLYDHNYWEAWKITLNSSGQISTAMTRSGNSVMPGPTVRDSSYINHTHAIFGGTFADGGYWRALGHPHIVCSEDMYGETPDKWHNDAKPAGSLYSTKTPPSWWTGKYSDSASTGKRNHNVNWVGHPSSMQWSINSETSGTIGTTPTNHICLHASSATAGVVVFCDM